MYDGLLTICVHILMGFLIVSYELLRHRSAPYDALFLINISFFVYFVLAPVHVLIGGEAYTRYDFVVENVGLGDSESPFWMLLCYILVIAGFRFTPTSKSYFSIYRTSSRFWWLVIAISIAIAVISSVIYSLSAGGLLSAVRQAIYIRMGAYEISGQWLFVKHFIPLFSSVFILGVSLFLREDSRKRNSIRWYFVLFILVCLALYGAILLGGRRVMLFPGLIVFFVYGNYKMRWNIGWMILLAIFVGFILVLWDAVSFGIKDAEFSAYLEGRYNTIGEVYAAVWKPLSDPYMGWVGLSNHDTVWLGFKDILFAPLQLLPESIFSGFIPESLIITTTDLLRGQSISDVAGIPPGFYGYFYLNGGYLGLIVGSIMYGMIGKILHGLFLPRTSDPVSWTIYMWLMFGWAYFIRHGMLEFVITERFHWWFSLLIAFITMTILIVWRHFIIANSMNEHHCRT